MKKLFILCLTLMMVLSIAGCSENAALPNNDPIEQDRPKTNQTTTPPPTDKKDDNTTVTDDPPNLDDPQDGETDEERLGFVGANIGMGGLMAGDGEWIYYRSEEDWGLYKARTDGSEKMLLLPQEDYAPASLNVLDEWVYFSNYHDGFSLYRVRTDGTSAEKLVDGYCYTLYVAESGIYFDWRDDNNGYRTFRMDLDGSEQELIAEGAGPVSYFDGTLYLYNFRTKTLSVYDVKTKETVTLTDNAVQAAYFSVDDTGVYYWDNFNDYCHLDPETGTVTVLRKGPIGDYYNYADGKVYFVAYGGENNDYSCCYALDPVTKEQSPILSLSDEIFDFDGTPIGLTNADYQAGNYDPEIIPKDSEGWPLMINERASELYIVNGQVFARGRVQESLPADCWIYCDGEDGRVWD